MLIPIYNTMKILNDPKVATELTNVLGKDGARIFKDNIMRTGKATNFEMGKVWQALDKALLRPLSVIGNNFMVSKIIGSVSSLFSQILSPINLAIKLNTTGQTALGFKVGVAYAKLMINPKSFNDLTDILAERIPAIKTDRTSYQVQDINSFKLFEASEFDYGPKALKPVVRKVVNATNGFTNLWLSKMMGTMDEFSKTAYSLAMIDSYLDGTLKGGPSKAQLNKWTENERMQNMSAYINDELKTIFPDKDETSVSYIQRHPIGRLFVPFFNDARIALNYIVFNRVKDVVDSFTEFPERASKSGITKAVAGTTKTLVFNTLILQFQLSLVDSLLRSGRGEDENEDKTTNKGFLRRWLKILKNDLIDPWTAARVTGEMLPGFSQVMFFVKSDGRGGDLKTPQQQWLTTVWKTAKNLKEVGFNPMDFEDRDWRDAVQAASGITPLPTSVLNNYVYGDSTAFKTGVKDVLAVPYILGYEAPRQSYNAIAALLRGDLEYFNAAEGDNKDYLQSVIQGQMNLLLAEPAGRAALKQAILRDQLAIMSDADLYDLIFTESNGDPLVVNNKSSATGIGQFLIGTWNDYAKKVPGIDLAYPKGEVPDDKIDGRTDPVQVMEVLNVFHKDIALGLVDKGIPPTQENIYIGHHFGPGAAPSLIAADDDAKLGTIYKDVVGAKAWTNVLKQNNWIKSDMTIAEFKAGISELLYAGAIKRAKWEEEYGEFNPMILPRP
jgi:hypothetical protein